MAGLVCRVCLIMCLIIVTQTIQSCASISTTHFLQKLQVIQGLLTKAAQDGRTVRQQTPSQTKSNVKFLINKPNMDGSKFLTDPRSKKTLLTGNFGIDKFVAFMSNANNLMNSNSGNRRIDNFMTAFNELFNSNGLNAFNVFYTLSANFWTVVDAVANVVRVTEGRIKDRKDEIRAEQEPDPLEELKETFEDTNNNLADVSNLVKILACDPNGGAETIPSECLTDRDIDEFLEEERSATDVKSISQIKNGQSQPKAPLQTRPQGQPQVRPPPSQPQVRPQALLQAPPNVVPQNQARSIPSNQIPTLHTRTHVQPQVQPPQNRLQIKPQISPQTPPQIPFQVILQTRAQLPQARQPIQPPIRPQVRSQAILQPQTESLGRSQVQPQYRPVNNQGRAFLPAQQSRAVYDRGNSLRPLTNNQQFNFGPAVSTTRNTHFLANQGRYHTDYRQTKPVTNAIGTNSRPLHNPINYNNSRVDRSQNHPQPLVNQWYYRNNNYPNVQPRIGR